MPFGAHQVDVRLAVELRAAEEEEVDAALAGEIEELARAFGKGVALALVQPGDADRAASGTRKLTGGRGNRRRGTDGDVVNVVADQPRDHAGKELFLLCQTNSSRYFSKPSRVRAALA